jgi:RsiW-degrading membrane proteinase PrsW (M82 family)
LIGKATLAVLLGLVTLAAAGWLVRRVRRVRRVTWTLAVALMLGGGAAALATFFVERAVFRFTELSIEATPGAGLTALLALLLFASPLEEAAKVAVVWPTVALRRLDTPGVGVVFAVSVASGFAAVETALLITTAPPSALNLVRAAAGIPAHAFCAGLWGYALGARARTGSGWFGAAWLLSVGVHALYDHIVFGRGPGMLAIAVPMLLAMVVVTWSALRDIAPSRAGDPVLPLHLPEPPSFREVRRALRRTDEPLVLRWIVLGALVNLGAAIVCVAGAALLARRFGIDMSLADEADMRSNGPLVIVAAALLTAFPVAGYLVARASGAHTVLEPAFAAGLAMALTVAILSVTAPSAVIFAFAVAPIAFGLACGGAWFGMDG